MNKYIATPLYKIIYYLTFNNLSNPTTIKVYYNKYYYLLQEKSGIIHSIYL